MGDVGGPRRVTARFRVMVEAYRGVAGFSASEAARIAGYKEPTKVGWRLKRRFPEVFERAEKEAKDALRVSRGEVEERLAALVRNDKHRDHFKALDLTARIHGMLSEKLNITIERTQVSTQIDELVRVMVATRATQQGLDTGPALLLTQTTEAANTQPKRRKKQTA